MYLSLRSTLTTTITCLLTTAFLVQPAQGFDADDILDAAAGVGITAESLVLAELEEDADTILTAAGQETSLLTTIQTLESSLTQYTDQVGSLLDALSLNPTDETLQTNYESAVQALQSTMTSLETARIDLFAAVTDSMAQGSVDMLLIWQTTSRYRVPSAFRVLELTHAEWKAVEKALRAEERATLLGEELDESYSTLLTSIRAIPAVIAAEQQLSLYLTTVEGDFDGFDMPE